MKQIASFIFLPFITTYVFAQNNKVSFQIQPDLEQIALWPDHMPDGQGPEGTEKITPDGSITNVSNPRLIVHNQAIQTEQRF